MFLLKPNKGLNTAELVARLNVMFVDTQELPAGGHFDGIISDCNSFSRSLRLPVMFSQTAIMILVFFFLRFWPHQAGLENKV